MTTTSQRTETLLEAMLASLAHAARNNPGDVVAPAAVLWPDGEGQWSALAEILRAELPHLLTLGPYNPATKTGPAIWLRCLLARTLPAADWPEEVIPIIYLPGVSRGVLREVEECPKYLQPLVELQFRGVVWSQRNGKDWTVAAFLASADGGLGLEVASDNITKAALLSTLPVLGETQVGLLRQGKITAAVLNGLVHPDVTRDLLRWMNDPVGTRAAWDAGMWTSFCGICRETFHFDPETDGALVAGEKLGLQEKPWGTVWQYFADAPAHYPNIPDLLRRAKPAKIDGGLFDTSSSWPQENETQETALRDNLMVLSEQTPALARQALRKLDSVHGMRRDWVWAKLGEAPLAQALEHLARLAQATETPLEGATPTVLAEQYVTRGWQADAAALSALATVEKAVHVATVKVAVEAVYRPWLEEAAQRFQELVREQALPKPIPLTSSEMAPGTCLLFADGLRYDIAQALRERLIGRGHTVEGGWTFTALPSVTATAKPALSPIADALNPASENQEFIPEVTLNGKALNSETFRKLLEERGVQVLTGDDTGDPTGKAWTACGSLDGFGHKFPDKLPRQIPDEVKELAERIECLLDAGWQTVKVVTDHGWLYLPTLPKVELPGFLAETRWGRCAALKLTSTVEYLTVPWHWNPLFPVAMAPGIAVFVAGKQYDHGGLSLQECVIPLLTVSAATAPATASISGIKWTGLRCRVEVTGSPGIMVDLRTKAGDPTTSIAETTKGVVGGQAALLVSREDLIGTSVFVVVYNTEDTPLTKTQTVVGGE